MREKGYEKERGSPGVVRSGGGAGIGEVGEPHGGRRDDQAGIRDLAVRSRPEQSAAGLVVTAAALVVMPLLALAKHRTGRALGNRALIADAAESAFCAFTSGAALLGVGLNAGLGWWWADPAAALAIAALAVKEGLEAWEDDDGDAD